MHCSLYVCIASVLEHFSFQRPIKTGKRGTYCTISIDSAWGVTCDAVDEILHMARLRRICDVEKNSAMSLSQACLKDLKLERKCDLIF